MAIKTYKPTTPSRRSMTGIDYSKELTKGAKPFRALLQAKKRISGRNNTGRVTVRHRGGGNKRFYRLIDFKRWDKLDIPGKVMSIEYDPNRTAFIALIMYKDGERRYILAPQGLEVGMSIICSKKAKAKVGNRMQLSNVPLGFDIHDVEIESGRGGQLVHTAGSTAKLVAVEGDFAQVQLPSGAVRLVPKECYATIGVLSNPDHFNVTIGKAGRMRWMGKKPQVLGKSMNACDHPHGGGEGHCPIGLKHPKTPWGLPALGVRTRKPKKYSDRLIVKTRNK